MSKTILRRLFVLALCACLVLLAVLPAGADFGDYSGDSDYGSSSDWSSSDSDWDWSSSDSDYSSSSESSGGISTIVVGAIIVFIAIVSTSRTKKKKGASGGTSRSAAADGVRAPGGRHHQKRAHGLMQDSERDVHARHHGGNPQQDLGAERRVDGDGSRFPQGLQRDYFALGGPQGNPGLGRAASNRQLFGH